MKRKHEAYLYLHISGFEELPESIASDLGVTPSKIWRQGDIRNRATSTVYEANGIHIFPDVEKEKDFDEQLASLMSIVDASFEMFVKVCNSCYTELRCVIYLYHQSEDSTPMVHFDKQTLKVLSALGAGIDFDLYAL